MLHRGSLRSAIELDKPAGTPFDRSFYEFAMHRVHSWFTDPLYTSIDSGASWQPSSVGGRWSSVSLSADGAKLFAADTSSDGAIWAAQSAPGPLLSLLNSNGLVILSWTVPSIPFGLQQNSDLTTTNWTDVTNAPTLNLTNLQYEVVAPTNDAVVHFYRLKH